jgi:Rieske Fe-S protein
MHDNGRRRFFSVFTQLLLGAIGVIVAIPAVSYLVAPLRRRSSGTAGNPELSDAGPLAVFPIGEWRLHALEVLRQDGWKKSRVRHAVWVRREGDGEDSITVLSSICPHLGCPINWQPEKSRFLCPCHGGVFAEDGREIAGPPPREMDPLTFEVRAGRLWIGWQDFKIGVRERIPVNV